MAAKGGKRKRWETLQSEHIQGLVAGWIMWLEESESVSGSVVSNSVIPWTAAFQAPLSMEFFRPEYWSGLYHFLLQETFPTQGSNPGLLQCRHQSHYSSVQFSSVAQSCPTLCDPMNHSTPGLPSITNSWSSLRLMSIESVMPSSHFILCRPLVLLPPIPPSISLFQWVNSSHEVAKVLEFQLQHHSFQRSPRTDLLQYGLVGSPCSPRDSQESSPTPQFKSIRATREDLM